MDNIRFQYLYEQYLNKRLNDKELQEWQAGLSDPDYNDLLLELTGSLWDRDDLPVTDYNKDRATALYQEIITLSDQNTNDESVSSGKPKVIKLWLRIASAAAVLTFIFGTALFFYHHQQSNSDQQQDIVPGGNKAILTLANGKKISLTDLADGSVANESGISITKTAGGQLIYTVSDRNQDTSALQYNTIEIPKGGQYQVRLPDGTAVWLNAASSLKYPISFSALKQRKVELTGEGYFEVAKDKNHPFIVKTSGQEVRVLGTHFNINGYKDEPAIKTTLLEGSVAVSSAAAGSKTLSPGQQAILSGAELRIHQVNMDETIAWKNGYFRFNSESIENIMKILSRWYNIEVSFEGNVKSKLFTGKISKFKNISQVLKMLDKTEVLNFKLEGRRVIVSE